MKKFINRPEDVVQETFAGFLALYGDLFYQVEGFSAVAKRELLPGKVALVIGGGSGHEPIFLEYIGDGYADAVCQGNVFAAPSPDIIIAGAKAVARGQGVLFVYGNYAGDNLNFDMAAELLELEGIASRTVRVMDDVASAPPERLTDRRGIAGDFFVIKVAGAACDAGLTLDEAFRVTAKARDNTRTMGVASAPGTIPGLETPAFTLPAGEMEIGLGLHGEPGVRRGKMMQADATVDEMLSLILPDLPFRAGDRVCVLVNGFGATTKMELFIACRRTRERLQQEGLHIHDMQAGNYAVCQEMAGFSLTLSRLDDELQKYYDWPAWSPVFTNAGVR